MKILKIFGLVVGIHLFALVLIFANPGCSTTTKPPPVPSDTIARPAPAPTITVPTGAAPAPAVESPVAFNPDAPAVAAPANSGSTVRFTPTRPGSPAAAVVVPEPVTDVTPARTYTVASGDNLWSLAKKHKVTVAELAGINNLSTNAVLRPGQKLIIPAASTGKKYPGPAPATAQPAPAAPEPARAAAVKPPADAVTHVVKSGETLGAIARRYGVKQGEIAVANNIADPQKIRPGMELVIPGWQTPGGKSGKAAGRSAPEKSKSVETRTPPASSTSEVAAPPPAPAEVPVIRVDDSPIAPAPKS